MALTNTWETAATAVPTSASPAVDALDISASAVILLMICWNAPKLAASMLGGSPSFTGGDAVSTAGGLAQGALLVGAAAAGGVALGAKMLAAKGGAMAVGQAAGMGAGGAASAAAWWWIWIVWFSRCEQSVRWWRTTTWRRQRRCGCWFWRYERSSIAALCRRVRLSQTREVASGETVSAPQDSGSGSSAAASAPSGCDGGLEVGRARRKLRARSVRRRARRKDEERTGRMARASEATNRVSRKLAVGTQFVRMARSAVPPDHAPHSAPPALRSEGEE